MAKKNGTEAFEVRVKSVKGGPGYVESFEIEEQARHDAERRNAETVRLGIKARYEAVAK